MSESQLTESQVMSVSQVTSLSRSTKKKQKLKQLIIMTELAILKRKLILWLHEIGDKFFCRTNKGSFYGS